MRRILYRTTVITAAAAAIAAIATSLAWAAFNSSGSASMSVATKRIFPTTATVAAYDVGDASAGAGEVASPEPAAFTDATTYSSTGSFATSFATTRYLDFTMSSPLAAGLAVSSPVFKLDYASSSTARTLCFYFEVYNTTTSALLETHGSTSSPVGCTTSTTAVTTSTPLTNVTTTDIADSLRVRVYMSSSVAAKGIVDRAVIAGSTAYQSFTLYPNQISDCSASCGTAVVTPARLAAQDTSTLVSAATWATTFATTRYIRLGFPPTVPAAATVSSATLNLLLSAVTAGRTLCVYVEVYSGATLLATHGSTTTPALCTSATTDSTLTLPLPEITTASQANTCQIRVYGKSNAAGKSAFDVATLTVGYSLT